MSPSFPVAINSETFPPGVISDSIGRMIPEKFPSPPITARPFILPIFFPFVTITS